jgi:phosphoadenosine phosphosulfate reductase
MAINLRPHVDCSDETIERWNPQQIIAWAAETFGSGLAMSSSFQQQSLALLHMVSRIAPEMPIHFVDTGHHFCETLQFKRQVTEMLRINVIDLTPEVTHEEQELHYGPELWKHDPDLCCYLNKVQPMQSTLNRYEAWLTGIRRDQSTQRAHTRPIECRKDGLVKVNPLVNWTQSDVDRYIAFHRLPTHPLFEQGYHSIGCAPCTRPITTGEDLRAGRWAGKAKKECGLHTVFRLR